MDETFVVQGRRITPEDIARIRELIAGNPNWSRWRLSRLLSAEWNWRNANGQLKDMAARSLLVKLNERELITLPPRRQVPSNRMASRPIPLPLWNRTPVCEPLKSLGSLIIREISTDPAARYPFSSALAEFHYLGYRGTVGENLQYMVTDSTGRLLACLLFGSAAWKCRPRDEYIGWTQEQRARNLHFLTNNTRYLILPWVRVPHLSSWILGQVLRRLSADWENKYGHPIALVETFVERDRFAGTSYRASNWIHVGSTAGRSRQDRRHTLRVAVKDVYVYSLDRRFRQELSS
ncbi:MAG: DUF4338 domain-containing protein [Acidobacteriota bacterium]